MTKAEPSATIVAVMMGMGHLRAAYPLRHIGLDGILIYGSESSTPKNEYKIWKKIRASYYFFSRAGELPLVMTPPIGAHEELNKLWLQDIHAGIAMPGPAGCCHEWLFDMRESGRLADAAWAAISQRAKIRLF
jgi:hypothetical protein